MRGLLLGAALAAITSPAFAATFISGAGGPATGIAIGTEMFVSDSVTDSDGTTEYAFTFTALEDLSVVNFGVAAAGSNSDLSEIFFNLDTLSPPNKTWTSFNSFGTGANGEFEDFGLTAGSSFTLTFYTEAGTNANVSAFFETAAFPVPVPAALPLMVGALGALGFAGYRRKG